jgi:predicted  nucleic acid-binding Zn-ribbon protein
MMEVIEKLLILQDRDRKLAQVREELAQIEPQRQAFKTRVATAQAAADAGKQRIMHLESERKKLELDVEAKKELIERYSNQQLQTRKNEEYRALSHEIEMCKDAIHEIEDQEIELMEQTEASQKQVAVAAQGLKDATKLVDEQVAGLGQREENLKKQLAALESDRATLAGAVDEGVRARYERLFKSKGGNVVVGVQHGVCGGCHMRVPAQLLVYCRGEQEIVTCQNCGRILYYTRDMDMIVAE